MSQPKPVVTELKGGYAVVAGGEVITRTATREQAQEYARRLAPPPKQKES